MKTLRRVVLLLALASIGVCVVLLLNITAPNPTHRRYSSAMPLITGQGNGQQIGAAGERILSNDLNLPNNNEGNQMQCICGQTPNPACNACLVQIPSLDTYRVPDFVGTDFIAESKNKQDLLYTGREVDQINDYVIAAHLMQRQLWVFVRVDTQVDPEFIRLVESTGGHVVHYFTTTGYTDPVDRDAGRALLLSGALVASMGWLELRGLRRRVRVVIVDLPSRNPAPKPAGEGIGRKLDAAKDYAAKSKDHLYDQLHDDSVWGDDA